MKDKGVKRNIHICVAALIVVLMLVGTVVSILLMTITNEMFVLDNYISSIPRILAEKEAEVISQNTEYRDDYKIQIEMGTILYKELRGMSMAKRLETVKNKMGFVSVAVVDDDGNYLGTTDPLLKQALTKEECEDLKNYAGQMLFFDEEEVKLLGNRDNTVIECRRIGGNDGNLILESDFSAVKDLSSDYYTWTSSLERMLSGLNGYAFSLSDDRSGFAVYPDTGHTEQELMTMKETLSKVIDSNEGSFLKVETGEGEEYGFGPLTIKDEICLAINSYLPDYNATVFIAIPFSAFTSSAILTSIACAGFLVFSIIIFAIYAHKKTADISTSEDKKEYLKKARIKTLPGAVTVAIAIVIFFTMILLLMCRGTIAYNSIAHKAAVKYEMDFNAKNAKRYRGEYPQKYLMRTNAIATIFSENPRLRTRSELKTLCLAANAKYLMLFDAEGKEICASNSYTGFTVSGNKQDQTAIYYPMLLGYPYVISEPFTDEVSGERLITVASLITDSQGLPDGFVILAADGQKYSDVLTDDSLLSTINKFATQDGQILAVVDEEKGIFTAHTDQSMVGQQAEDVLDKSVIGKKYEGFTKYDDKNVYISGSIENGGNLFVIIYDNVGRLFEYWITFIILVVVLIWWLFCYPSITALSFVRYEQRVKMPNKNRLPVHTLLYGYLGFLAVFTLFAIDFSAKGQWPEMNYIFEGNWTKGVHLFSIWMAVFFFTVVFSLVLILRAALAAVDKYLSTRSRTVFRLIDSLLTYTAAIILLVYIFAMFGVDTKTMVASAGVVSIAVGMGSRDIVTDIMAGLFMIFEGTIHVGDEVAIGNWKGVVTDMGIRTTEITNENNDVKIVSNSRIGEVVNMSREKNRSNTEVDNNPIDNEKHTDRSTPEGKTSEDEGKK